VACGGSKIDGEVFKNYGDKVMKMKRKKKYILKKEGEEATLPHR